MDLYQTLAALCGAAGPSGFEGAAAAKVAELAAQLADEINIDALGNVIARKKARLPNPGGKTLMLDAHIDEIGFIITGYEGGFLRFDTLGRLDTRILPGQTVTVLADTQLPGCVDCLPPHMLSAEDRASKLPLDKLFIDVGLDGERVKKTVPVGTPAVIDVELTRMENGKVTGRALDNRAGVAAMLYAFDLLNGVDLAIDVVLCASVMEESGGRGAKTAAFSIRPDWCVVVDATYGRQEGVPGHKTFALGSGVALGVGPNMCRELTQKAERLARDNGISTTREVMAGNTHTNAWQTQVSRGGVPTAVFSIPLQSMHTPVETVKLSDIEQTGRLAALLAQELSREVV